MFEPTKRFINKKLEIDLNQLFTSTAEMDRAVFIVDKINQFIKYKNKDKDSKGFAKISSTYWRAVLGQTYDRKILNILQANNIITRKNHSQGHFPKPHSINPIYLNSSVDDVTSYTLTDKKFISKLKAWTKSKNETRELKYEIYNNISSALNNINICIPEASKIIVNNAKLKYPKYNQLSEYQRYINANINTILSIDSGELFLSRDDNGRLYSNITSLSKSLIPTLINKISGKIGSFISVDISNSQPFLLLCVISNDYPELAVKPDFKKILDFAKNGVIYDEIANELNFSRQFVKETGFFETLIFSRDTKSYLNNRKELSEADLKELEFLNFIKEKYNSLYTGVVRIKKEITNKGMSNKLQGLEAKLMIDGVTKKMIDIPVFANKHDEILCLPEDSDEVKHRIEYEFQEELNIVPHVKIGK